MQAASHNICVSVLECMSVCVYLCLCVSCTCMSVSVFVRVLLCVALLSCTCMSASEAGPLNIGKLCGHQCSNLAKLEREAKGEVVLRKRLPPSEPKATPKIPKGIPGGDV